MRKFSLIAFIISWPLVAFLIGGLVSSGAYQFLGLLSIDIPQESSTARLFATIFSVTVATTLILLPLRFSRNYLSLKKLGLTSFPLKGLAVVMFILIFALILSYTCDLLYQALGVGAEFNRNAASFGSKSISDLLINILIAGVITAVIEELMFRGFMFGFLKGEIGLLQSATVTSLLFSVFHLSIVEVPFLFVFSLGLCWLRCRLKSVFPGMIVHAIFNALLLVAAYFGLSMA